MARKQSVLLASARSYYRLAAKAERNDQPGLAHHYRMVADRLVDQNRRNQEYIKEMSKNAS